MSLEIFKNSSADIEAQDERVMNALVKLLAEEDVTVITSTQFKTAFFDLKSRFVGLPAWTKMSRELKMMLRFHECSHALFSEASAFHDFVEGKYPRLLAGIVNICEDDRVDRLMVKRFPGAKKFYQEGYKYFLPEWKEYSKSPNMTFADRLNLASKAAAEFPFTPENKEEAALHFRFKTTSTIEEVIAVAKDIYEYIKRDDEKDSEQDSDQGDQSESDQQQSACSGGETQQQNSEQEQGQDSESDETEQGQDSESDEVSSQQSQNQSDSSDESDESDESEQGQETSESDTTQGSYTGTQDIMKEKEEKAVQEAEEVKKDYWGNVRDPKKEMIVLRTNKSNFIPYKKSKNMIQQSLNDLKIKRK